MKNNKWAQIARILEVALVATAVMLVFEIFFSFKEVQDWFGMLVIQAGPWAYVVIWLIMFLQVTVLNVPAYVILNACVVCGIPTLDWKYILVVLSAYILGALLAYWLGDKVGTKAIKWCAGNEEDYNKWCTFINNKGKIWYFLTILFPLFPDDLLCIAAGAVHMNRAFFTIANVIGRGIGLVLMLLTLNVIGSIGSGFPYMIIIWAVALVAEFIAMKLFDKRAYTIVVTMNDAEKEKENDK